MLYKNDCSGDVNVFVWWRAVDRTQRQTMGVWFATTTTTTSPLESIKESNGHGTTLQTLEAFREQIMQLCVKIIDPDESELVEELMELCAQLGDVEAMIYCTKLLVPHRQEWERLQALVETLRRLSRDDATEPSQDATQVLSGILRQHGFLGEGVGGYDEQSSW